MKNPFALATTVEELRDQAIELHALVEQRDADVLRLEGVMEAAAARVVELRAERDEAVRVKASLVSSIDGMRETVNDQRERLRVALEAVAQLTREAKDRAAAHADELVRVGAASTAVIEELHRQLQELEEAAAAAGARHADEKVANDRLREQLGAAHDAHKLISGQHEEVRTNLRRLAHEHEERLRRVEAAHAAEIKRKDVEIAGHKARGG